ncbi:sodium-coupled neutral amino acid transporter 3-like isoform X2 [Epinephelus fuscoguttatus]|uniref:sodium-coupled neutral amino acid transporter 3-like isoform X2 n=1 Tax=Epinephelus fuscoguttatus TaxID=293821 RepID=UPI0020D0DD52|nr:sodium-coupled neutral amino acid transporter 3-like isoform X2 [Epinephelus fuscoguttatus]
MELQKLSNGNHHHEVAVPVEGGVPPEEEKFLQHRSDGSKRPQFTDFEGKTSFGMSVFNLSNAIMGSGILGLSYAMSNTGIILFLILLTCIALLSCYSIHLLLRSAGVVGIRAYEQLGLRAFGHPGKIVAAVIITLHNIGAMSSYLFIVKSELPLVIQAFLGHTSSSDDWFMNGNYLIIIVTVCLILPLTLMKHLGYLGYTSGFSLSCMVFFLSAVIYKKFNIACPLEVFGNHSVNTAISENTCTAKFLTINQETAYTIPILAFAFVCHPEVLPIYTELSNPTKRRMQNIGNVSILGMFIMYFLTATFGYLTFYENTEAELLHTYSKVDPLDTLILCVRLAVLVAVTLTVPVVLFPVRMCGLHSHTSKTKTKQTNKTKKQASLYNTFSTQVDIATMSVAFHVIAYFLASAVEVSRCRNQLQDNKCTWSNHHGLVLHSYSVNSSYSFLDLSTTPSAHPIRTAP